MLRRILSYFLSLRAIALIERVPPFPILELVVIAMILFITEVVLDDAPAINLLQLREERPVDLTVLIVLQGERTEV